MVVGVVCAVGAACAFGGCSVLQHLTARTEPRRDAWLLVRLVRRPLWLAGGALNALGVFLQGLALAYVPILVVAPVRLAGLPIALPLTALADRRRVRADELGAALLCAAGGAGFLLSAGAHGGRQTIVPVHAAILLGVVLVIDAIGRLLARIEGWRYVSSAAVGGLLNGFNAVLLSTVSHALGAGHYRLLAWALPELAFVGLLGLLRAQQGLQAPGIGTPLAALTITEPIAAVAGGAVLLGETVSGGTAAHAIQAVSAVGGLAGAGLLRYLEGARQRAGS